MKLLKSFGNAWNKIKGVISGGSDTETENTARKDIQGKLTSNEINFRHNHTMMMKKRVALRKVRNQMRRKTQQSQRS